MLSKKELSFVLLPTLLFDTAEKVIAWLLFGTFGVYVFNFVLNENYRQENVKVGEEAERVYNAVSEGVDNKQAYQKGEVVCNEPSTHEEKAPVPQSPTAQLIAALPTPARQFLASFEATTASALMNAKKHCDNLSNAAPATSTPHHSLYSEQEQEDTRSVESPVVTYSLFLPERNEAGQHIIASSDTSILGSPYCTNYDETATMPWRETSSSEVSMEDEQSEPEWCQVPYNNPVYNFPCTYYPNCSNRKCKFIHPGPVINVARKRSSSIRMTKDERILRQAQDYIPQSKSRCNHWPYCTNNNCKYTHPVKDCRNGDECPIAKRCMFVHPSDRID